MSEEFVFTRGYALAYASVVAFRMQMNHSLRCNQKCNNSQSHSKGYNRVMSDWLIFALVPRFFLHTREFKFQKTNMAAERAELSLLCSRDLDKNKVCSRQPESGQWMKIARIFISARKL